ncbi:MAG TPA: hypothetical protein PK050_17255 [Hyphomonadaceae bacterium]|nr:hypothetical protein [Hyphomonadaceae bacterium]
MLRLVPKQGFERLLPRNRGIELIDPESWTRPRPQLRIRRLKVTAIQGRQRELRPFPRIQEGCSPERHVFGNDQLVASRQTDRRIRQHTALAPFEPHKMPTRRLRDHRFDRIAKAIKQLGVILENYTERITRIDENSQSPAMAFDAPYLGRIQLLPGKHPPGGAIRGRQLADIAFAIKARNALGDDASFRDLSFNLRAPIRAAIEVDIQAPEALPCHVVLPRRLIPNHT